MRAIRPSFRSIMRKFIAPVVLIGCAGCGAGPSAPPRVAGAIVHSAASDDSRARMTLEQICPLPGFPAPTIKSTDAAPADERALRQLERGRKRLADQHWADAMAAFDRAIERAPGLNEARALYARAAMRLGDFPAARAKLNDILAREPRSVVARQLLGEMASRERKTVEAIRELRMAIAASDEPSPESVLARLTLAKVLQGEDYLLAAAEQYDAFLAATRSPTPEMAAHVECNEAIRLHRVQAPTALGDLRTALGQPDEAVAAYRRAAKDSPDETGPRRRLILAMAQAGRHDEALEAARREAIRVEAADVALDLLRDVCEAIGDRARYDEEVQLLARDAKDPRVIVSLARILVERGSADEAAEVLARVAEDESVRNEAAALLADIRIQQGDATAAYALVLDIVRRNSRRLDEQARWLVGHGRDSKLAERIVAAAKDQAALHPKDGLVRALYGRLLCATGSARQAVEELRTAVKLAEDPTAVYGALASGLCEIKAWDEAIEIGEKAVEADAANRDAFLALGTARGALDDYEGAEKAFLAAFELDRKWAEPLFRLAELAERRGQQRQADQLYRRILDDVDPRHLAARERLVVLYLNSGNIEKCREYFSDFEALGLKGPEVDRCSAMLALTVSTAITPKERLAEYLAALRASLERYPGDWKTHTEIARSYSAVNDYEKAFESIEKALAIAPDDLPARELKANLLAKLLRFDEASVLVRGMLKDRPRDLTYMQELLRIAEARGDWAMTAELLRELIARDDLKDQRPAFTNMLITALVHAENWDDAVATAKAWLDSAPSDVLRRSTYLRTLGQAGRHDEAIEAALSLLAQDPQSRTLQIELLSRLQEAKRYTEAIQYTVNWLAGSPEDLDLNAALVRLCWSAKRWDDAIDIARSNIELKQNRAIYETLLGESYRFAGRYDDAIRLYKDKLENWEARRRKVEGELRAGVESGRERLMLMELRDAISEAKRANLTLIGVMILAERYRAAERQINKTLGPELEAMKAGQPYDQALMIDMRNLLSEVYADTDRNSQAIQQLEAIYELDPTDPGVNNNLGYLLADLGQDIERAEKMIRFSLAEDPNSHASLDSLGWVLYKRSRFEEAAYYIRQALKLSPREDPVLRDHLGDALYRKGDIQAAQSEWRAAVKMCAPDHDPPPDHDRKLLYTSLKAKLAALEAGETPTTAAVVVEATSQPAEAAP